MVRQSAAALAVVLGIGCGGEPRSASRGSETEDAGDFGRTTVVTLTGAQLRIEPLPDAPAVAEVAGGTALTVVGDTMGPGPGAEPWLRVATWDDRRGWVPADQVLTPDLWSHYQVALGGAAITALRAAYPVGDGRWAVEAPLNSPGITSISTVWLLADPVRAVKVAAIDSVAAACGTPHRMAILAEDAGGGRDLSRAVLAVPASRRPQARLLAIAPLPLPDAALEAVIQRSAARMREMAGTEPRVWLWSMGEDARWVTLRWPAGDGGRAGEHAAALLLERSGAGWSARTVVPQVPSDADPDRAPFEPAAAYATAGPRPTILVVEAIDLNGSRVDLYLAQADGYRRLRAGYLWGCRIMEPAGAQSRKVPETVES